MTNPLEVTEELVEGMEKTDLQAIRSLAWSLHEQTKGLRDTPLPPQEYERQAAIRRKMCLKISDASASLREKMKDLEALVRDLRSLRSWLSADRDALESLKISGYVRQKEERLQYRPLS